jgi:hypothetical protein
MEEEIYNKEQIILQDLTSAERKSLEQRFAYEQTGCGTIYEGEHHRLEYRPKRDPYTLKCTGVELVIFRNPKKNKDLPISMPRYVPFKPGWIFNKAPYKERLEEMVAYMTKDVQQFDENIKREDAKREKEKAERAAAIEAHAEKVSMCQLKIDATMKAIAPKINAPHNQTQHQTTPEKSAENRFSMDMSD